MNKKTKQLLKLFPSSKFYDVDPRIATGQHETWKEAERHWFEWSEKTVAIKGVEWTVWVDCGKGLYAIFEGDILRGTGSRMVEAHDGEVVFLGECYGPGAFYSRCTLA